MMEQPTEESQFPSWVGSVARYTTKLAEACQSLLKKRVTGILSNELATWVSQRAREAKILDGQHSQRRMWPPQMWPPQMTEGQTWWGGALWRLEVLCSEFLVEKPLFKTKTHQRTFGSISKNNFTCPDFVIEGVANLTSRQWRQNPCRRRSLEEGTCPLWIKAESSHQLSLPLTPPPYKKKKKQRNSQYTILRLFI